MTERAEPAAATVAICIATCRRPDGLRALLESLNNLSFSGPEPQVRLIVVDNDPARPAVDRPGDLSTLSRWPVSYMPEPRRGIVSARNRALDAVPVEAEFVAFVDDDETVCPGWLDALLRVLRTTGAEAAQGPVVPRYEATPPDWVEALSVFALGPWTEAAPLGFASTNNSCVRMDFLRAHGLRFDFAFNETGGEDEDFFVRLMALGGRIVAAPAAVVYDTVPAHRMTPGWYIGRARRKGNTLGRIARKQGAGRAPRLAKGLGQLATGAALVATAGLFSRTARLRWRAEAARGLGTLEAFANIEVREYSAAAVERDRPGLNGVMK